MAYSITWDETKPDDNNYGYEIDNYIRDLATAVRERLATEHADVTGSGGTAYLMHKWAKTAKSSGSPYTLLATDNVVLITTGASDYTINLPTAVGISGKPYTIKKVDSGAGDVIITPNGTEKIDGYNNAVLVGKNDSITIMSDNANWVIIENRIPTGKVSDTGRTTASPGHILCDNSAISRTKFAALFAEIGTTFGVGDGATTFNVPNAPGKFSLAKAAAGTGSTLGETGGAIDHHHHITPTNGGYNAAPPYNGSNSLALYEAWQTTTENPPYIVFNREIKV